MIHEKCDEIGRQWKDWAIKNGPSRNDEFIAQLQALQAECKHPFWVWGHSWGASGESWSKSCRHCRLETPITKEEYDSATKD